MFDHAEIWAGLDRLAASAGLTPSGLARTAGLDPTSFNPSKRLKANGRPRWPSTESLAKALTATGTSLTEFARLMHDLPRQLPMLDFSRAGAGSHFCERGFPVGESWNELPLEPPLGDGHFGLRMDRADHAPLLRPGDVIVAAPTAPLGKGDRVLLRRRDGRLHLGWLKHRSPDRLVLGPLAGQEAEHIFEPGKVGWLARINWIATS